MTGVSEITQLRIDAGLHPMLAQTNGWSSIDTTLRARLDLLADIRRAAVADYLRDENNLPWAEEIKE